MTSRMILQMLFPCECLHADRTAIWPIYGMSFGMPRERFLIGKHMETNGASVHRASQVTFAV